MSVRRVTPAGSGGVAVLEVRGADALERVARLAGRRPRVGALALVRLEQDGELVDEALVWAESEERCEVHLHGSPALVERVRASLAGPRREPAGEEGERAPDDAGDFWSTDACWDALSLEEQAFAALAQAPSEAAARVLLDQAEGALRSAFEGLLAVPEERGEERARALALLRRARAAAALWRPPTIVLAGPVNAGKSTLFNALVGEERVLVSDEEGTTRDAVRARVLLGGHAFELVDTAGERTLASGGAASAVERAGQGLAAELASRADLVLRLEPAGSPAADRVPAAREVLLQSRVDELEPGRRALGRLPAIDALHDPLGARSLVAQLVTRALGLDPEPWQAGRAVPFTLSQWALLEPLAAGPPPAARAARAGLRALLGRPPSG